MYGVLTDRQLERWAYEIECYYFKLNFIIIIIKLIHLTVVVDVIII